MNARFLLPLLVAMFFASLSAYGQGVGVATDTYPLVETFRM